MPESGERFAQVFGELANQTQASGNLIADTYLPGSGARLTVVSADADFARFPQLKWFNPLNATTT